MMGSRLFPGWVAERDCFGIIAETVNRLVHRNLLRSGISPPLDRRVPLGAEKDTDFGGGIECFASTKVINRAVYELAGRAGCGILAAPPRPPRATQRGSRR